uniref:Uncharacterized protein n=1 Tax=Trichobilharzia regenti TaxID=157069 RepID=A0AA85J0H6_TRIRE|nr:unnamed protein product [Trichobilharzia regenti]
MRRVVIQCRKDEDIPILMEIINSFNALLIRPDTPERFDMIHVEISEESETTLTDFRTELEDRIPDIAVKIF